MLDFEIIKHRRYLEKEHVRYVDEFLPNKLFCVLEASGVAYILDLKKGTKEEVNMHLKFHLQIVSVTRIPSSKHTCYLVKHKYGIKIISPTNKKWYETNFEFQIDREVAITKQKR